MDTSSSKKSGTNGLETIVDPLTKRDLSNTKEEINKNKIKIWVSLSFALLALVLIIAASIYLAL